MAPSASAQVPPSSTHDLLITAKVSTDAQKKTVFAHAHRVTSAGQFGLLLQSDKEASEEMVSSCVQLQSDKEVPEDYTTAGETDSDLSDLDSPQSSFQPPPDVSLPSALLPPPGLTAPLPSLGVPSHSQSSISSLSSDSSGKEKWPSRKVTAGKVEEKLQHTEGSHRQSAYVCSLLESQSESQLDNLCEDDTLDRCWQVDKNDLSNSGSIEMVCLGPVTVQLSTDSKLFIKTQSQMEPVFVRAKCIHVHRDGSALVHCTLRKSATEWTNVESRLEDLLLDVRIAVDDDPRMVPILNALTKTGRVARIFAEFHTGELYCDICNRKRHEVVALAHVVAELRDLEALRRDANLLRYQRQLNSLMVGDQRRRRLGLHSVHRGETI